jgi:hypothetical protein
MVYREISRDLKDAALRLWDLGWEEEDIIAGLVVSCASLYCWKKLFEELGNTVCLPSPLVSRPRVITRTVLTCYNIYQKDPDIYLDELCFWLAIHHDIVITVAGLQQNLAAVGLDRKILYTIACKHDQQQRQDHWATTDTYAFNRDVGYSVATAMSKDRYLAVKVLIFGTFLTLYPNKWCICFFP